MPVEWNKVETWERLLASIYATDVKINLREVAQYFGATYDTLENRVRKIKAMAEDLKKDKGSGDGSAASASTKPTSARKPKSPKKIAGNTVTSGRITKPQIKPSSSIKPENVQNFELEWQGNGAGLGNDNFFGDPFDDSHNFFT